VLRQRGALRVDERQHGVVQRRRVAAGLVGARELLVQAAQPVADLAERVPAWSDAATSSTWAASG